MQSAGPFTLKPGAINYITVGIPFAQATSGNAWSSVELLRQVDDKCQSLFENCFKILTGPEAPTVTVQELSNEVILYLSYENPESNNNKNGIPESFNERCAQFEQTEIFRNIRGRLSANNEKMSIKNIDGKSDMALTGAGKGSHHHQPHGRLCQ